MSARASAAARLPRRAFLRTATGAVGGALLATQLEACRSGSSFRSPEDAPTTTPDQAAGSGQRVLLAYFSRAGENYAYGGRTNLALGNTAVAARLLAAQLPCDVHEIEAAEPYATSYHDTVARNVREQRANARPAIAQPLGSISTYNTVILASPIWNVRPPMIMSTFAERYDFAGKTVYPLTTHAMSGLGTTVADYGAACPGATIGPGLALQGETVADAAPEITAWLRSVGLVDS